MVARMAVLKPKATKLCKVPTRRISFDLKTMSARPNSRADTLMEASDVGDNQRGEC